MDFYRLLYIIWYSTSGFADESIYLAQTELQEYFTYYDTLSET